MSAKWKRFTGSMTKERMDDVESAKHGFTIRLENSEEIRYKKFFGYMTDGNRYQESTHYLIHKPLSHAEMRAEHALTGREVEVIEAGKWRLCENPKWLENRIYRFKGPEAEVVRYREFLYKSGNRVLLGVINKDSEAVSVNEVENGVYFVEWIHENWQEREI